MRPDFLCIGAPKTGTTWLYKHLSVHPGFWLPPVKELHYFDRRFPLPSAGDKVTVRKGVLGFFSEHSRRRIIRAMARSALRGRLSELTWTLRYFGGSATDEWYLSLFAPAEGRVSGDMTTDYCALSEDAVHYVRTLLPDVKIIFLMRDPVERAWSHAKMLLPDLLGKPLQQISPDEFLAYLSSPGPRARGAYLRTLAHWESAFPPEQLFIGFSDDVSGRPESFLAEILRFLGASPDLTRLRLDLTVRVNPGSPGSPRGMPRPVAEMLTRLYLPDLRALAARFGSHPSNWLASASAFLDASVQSGAIAERP